MSEKKTSYPPINIGTSFMLMVFIILCMVIFAVLSFSNALKDYEYSSQSATRATAYYEACNEAERILAGLEADGSKEETVAYTVSVDEDEILNVTLTRRPDGTYAVDTWKVESLSQWTADETLPVLGSE